MATGYKGLINGKLLGTLKLDFLTNPYAFYLTGQPLIAEHTNFI